MCKHSSRLRPLLASLFTGIGSIGFAFWVFGLPGHLEDGLTWLRWYQENAPVALSTSATLLIVGLAVALSEIWVPFLDGRRRLRRLAPLIEEFLRQTPWLTEDAFTKPAAPAENPTTLIFTSRVLEQELHALKIRHRNLLLRIDGWSHFLERLLKASYAGDLKEAREAGEWWISFAAQHGNTRTGMRPGKGTYQCTSCGWYVTIGNKADHLPPCDQCGAGVAEYTKAST